MANAVVLTRHQGLVTQIARSLDAAERVFATITSNDPDSLEN